MRRDPAQINWSLLKDGDGAMERKGADICDARQAAAPSAPCCSQPLGEDVF